MCQKVNHIQALPNESAHYTGGTVQQTDNSFNVRTMNCLFKVLLTHAPVEYEFYLKHSDDNLD